MLLSLLIFLSSIISFNRVYVTYVIPNIVYDPVGKTFAPAVKVCVMAPQLVLGRLSSAPYLTNVFFSGIEHYTVLVSLTIERVGMVISKVFKLC